MIDLKQYGYIETEIPSHNLIPGRVTELRREQYTVITEHGDMTAVLKGSFYHNAVEREDFPCVGDFVLLQHNAIGVSLIAKVLPRRSKFSRSDFSGHAAGHVKTVLEQVVATNFDYVFILSSLNSDFNVNRIMRYVTQARQSGGQPVIILTKADLVDDYSLFVEEIRQAVSDVPIFAISSHTGYGLEGLYEYLQSCKTVVFLGMSGVGKSSLLNALMEREVMDVKAIREDDSRGRHTTTHRQLFMLSSGAMVIDTPGMRELGLLGVDDAISMEFSDIEKLFAECRFRNCKHNSEPGCAILAALTDGVLRKERWEQYLKQYQENEFARSKQRGPKKAWRGH